MAVPKPMLTEFGIHYRLESSFLIKFPVRPVLWRVPVLPELGCPGRLHHSWLRGLRQDPVSLPSAGHLLRSLATLTQFFSVYFFVKKIIDFPGGQINPFLTANPSSPSRTLEGLFELTRHTLKLHWFLIAKSQKIFELVTRTGHLFRPLGQLVELVLYPRHQQLSPQWGEQWHLCPGTARNISYWYGQTPGSGKGFFSPGTKNVFFIRFFLFFCQ